MSCITQANIRVTVSISFVKKIAWEKYTAKAIFNVSGRTAGIRLVNDASRDWSHGLGARDCMYFPRRYSYGGSGFCLPSIGSVRRLPSDWISQPCGEYSDCDFRRRECALLASHRWWEPVRRQAGVL